MKKENTEANKAFILEMISQKKKLEDYPDRASEDMVVYEPSSLPFGGTYKGIGAYQEFYPKVREFYDFTKFKLLNVYGDGDAVFAIIQAGVAGSNAEILLCEQFGFVDGKILTVRLFIHDFEGHSIHSIIMS